jgi:cell division protein FtsI (penicillin-binding protein 3)
LRESLGTPRARGYERRGAGSESQPAPSKATGGIAPKNRLAWIRVLLAVVFVAMGLRLVQIQVGSHAKYAAIAAGEITTTVETPPMRGTIYDRNGGVLAMTEPRTDVIADPFLINDPAQVATVLGPLLGQPVASLESQLSEHSGYVVLAKELDTSVGAKVTALNLPGVTLQADAQRVNPDGELASPVLGVVGSGANGSGEGGIEAEYNSLLSAQSSSSTVEESLQGIPLPGTSSTKVTPRTGRSIELTLDEPLQYVAEQALGAEIVTSHAQSGMAVVMNVKTGDILAMANLVDDPSTKKVIEAPENLALDSVYEPGSVFKLVTFSAALQDNLITPTEVFSVPNQMVIDGSVFHDAESHPTEQLSATDILAQSSNLGTIQIAEKLGSPRLADQITTLGYGEPTGLDFPGESAGIVPPLSEWSPTSIGSTPIGQADAVTAQQVLDVTNAVANGGVFVAPRLVEATISSDGKIHGTKPSSTHRVMSTSTANELTTMMEAVAQDGTGVDAGIPGYTVAGKTGTAQVPSASGGYIPGAYMATFSGFAPAENPVLSAIVVLNQPTPIFGGTVAAPVFSQVMQYALHRYGVPTSPNGGTTGGVSQVVPYNAPGVSADVTGAATGPGTISGVGSATEVP